jgi:hypothetical protein
MKKSVIAILLGLIIVPISVLVYVSFSERFIDTEVVLSMVSESKGNEVSLPTEMTIDSKHPIQKDEGIFPLPNKALSVLPKKDEHSLPRHVPVTQEDMLRLIESFGNPTEEALRWIMNDERHREFESSLEKLFGESLPDETTNALLESARLAWYRQDMLVAKYESGEIDMDQYLAGLEEVIRADNETLVRELTDEQYMTLMEESKGERFSERKRGAIVPTDGYNEMLSLFPALRNGEWVGIASSVDVYKIVPKEMIEEVMRINREELYVQRILRHAYLAGDIQEETLQLSLDNVRQIANDKIDAILSPEQELFLYGHSDRLKVKIP